MQTQLRQEFAYEIDLLSGGRNLTANLESVYARAVSISGPAADRWLSLRTDRLLRFRTAVSSAERTDKPADRSALRPGRSRYTFARNTSTRLPLPRFPSAASMPLPAPMRVPSSLVPAGPIAADQSTSDLGRLCRRESGQLAVTLGQAEPLLDSGTRRVDDVERQRGSSKYGPPGQSRAHPTCRHFFDISGPVRIDQFFGRLEGHPYVPRPFEYGQKISVKPLSFLELGFARTVTIGGQGSGNPLTSRQFLSKFLGIHNNQLDSVPGDAHTEMDWTFYVPGVRNYIVLYGDANADDDILPIKNPPKNPWHPGIYITRFPGLPKLDLHVEGVSTEQPGLCLRRWIWWPGDRNRGHFNYWNMDYRDGYTNGRQHNW